MKRVNPHKIVGVHPYLPSMPVDLKWYRGANRYNNGCTRYGRKYQLRLIIGWAIEYQFRNDERYPWLQSKDSIKE